VLIDLGRCRSFPTSGDGWLVTVGTMTGSAGERSDVIRDNLPSWPTHP